MKEESYQRAAQGALDGSMVQRAGEKMTVAGAVNKTFILATIMLATAVIGYTMASPILWIGGAIGGLIVVIIASMRPHLSPTLAPLYAALEGFFVGAVSAYYAEAFSGIILHAVSLTMAVLFIMLFVYKAGIIKVTNKFRTGVIMATGAIFVVYLMSWILSMFGINIPYLHEGGMMGIGISLVIIGVASLNCCWISTILKKENSTVRQPTWNGFPPWDF